MKDGYIELQKFQDLSAFSLPAEFRGKPAWFVQLWWLVQATLFRWSPQFMYGWRRTLLRLFGAKIGRAVLIRPSARVTYPWKVTVGDYSWIGDDVVLYSLGEIEIGSHVVVSQKSYLCTGSHDCEARAFDIFSKRIIVEDEAWIATDVFIAPGVTIGRGSVVGARSTVLKSLPPMIIAFGTPASPIRTRTPEKRQQCES